MDEEKMMWLLAGMENEQKQMQVIRETNAFAQQFGLSLTDT